MYFYYYRRCLKHQRWSVKSCNPLISSVTAEKGLRLAGIKPWVGAEFTPPTLVFARSFLPLSGVTGAQANYLCWQVIKESHKDLALTFMYPMAAQGQPGHASLPYTYKSLSKVEAWALLTTCERVKHWGWECSSVPDACLPCTGSWIRVLELRCKRKDMKTWLYFVHWSCVCLCVPMLYSRGQRNTPESSSMGLCLIFWDGFLLKPKLVIWSGWWPGTTLGLRKWQPTPSFPVEAGDSGALSKQVLLTHWAPPPPPHLHNKFIIRLQRRRVSYNYVFILNIQLTCNGWLIFA